MRDSAPAAGKVSRRTVMGGGAAVALSAASYRRMLGANERVGLGFIGFGLIGKRHVLDFKDQPDADVVGVAEVHGRPADEGVALAGGSVRGYTDFRALLDDRDVDAVVVSTPGSLARRCMTMLACAAGKDVYVEKPLSLFPAKGGGWSMSPAGTTGSYRSARSSVGPSLPEGAGAGPRRPDRPGRGGSDVALPQCHARVRLARGRSSAAGTGL